MMGVCLFVGFLAGIVFTALIAVLLPRWLPVDMERREETSRPQEAQRENRELTRLRRQLAEIERYNGGAAYGTEAEE